MEATTSRPPIHLRQIRIAFIMETTGATERPLAVFLDVPWNPTISKSDVLCYSQMEQHSSCDIEYARALRGATVGERAQLLKELKGIYAPATIEVVEVTTTATWETP